MNYAIKLYNGKANKCKYVLSIQLNWFYFNYDFRLFEITTTYEINLIKMLNH